MRVKAIARIAVHSAASFGQMVRVVNHGVAVRDAAKAFDLCTSKFARVETIDGIVFLSFRKALAFTMRARREGLNAFDLYMTAEAFCIEDMDEAVKKLRGQNGIYDGPLTRA